MLSRKCKYAIRAVLFLSVECKDGCKLKGGREISDSLKLPHAFTGKILQQLARQNIISSAKGPGGGFYLSDDNRKKPLIKIIEAMGDVSVFSSCGLGLSKCSDTQPCPIHDSFKTCRDELLQLFSTKTISDLSEEIVKRNLSLVR